VSRPPAGRQGPPLVSGRALDVEPTRPTCAPSSTTSSTRGAGSTIVFAQHAGRGARGRPPMLAGGLARRHVDAGLRHADRHQPARRGVHRAGGGAAHEAASALRARSSHHGPSTGRPAPNDPYTPYSYANRQRQASSNFTKQGRARTWPAGGRAGERDRPPARSKTHPRRQGADVGRGGRDVERGRARSGRMGDPKEIRGLALLLASGAGSFMTGGVYPIDGGGPPPGPVAPAPSS